MVIKALKKMLAHTFKRSNSTESYILNLHTIPDLFGLYIIQFTMEPKFVRTDCQSFKTIQLIKKDSHTNHFIQDKFNSKHGESRISKNPSCTSCLVKELKNKNGIIEK